MKKHLIFLMAAAAFLLIGCNQKSGEPKTGQITAGKHTQVQTTYGTVEGYLDEEVYTFKGIRYAKADRFMPPQYPDKFDGVRMCKLYGPKAPQSETLLWRDDTQRDYSFGNQFIYEPMDEKDCLVLNVWTKGINDGGKRPVFLWTHGGGYATGSGHDLDCYEGKALADKGDIVVVNINHRLNILGYIDLTALGGKYENSVNLGMQDIVKALEWVRDNIEKFGGDPSKVTIGGQSGGGGKVSTLTAMPSAKGLFSGAIVQSGSTLRLTEKEASQKYGLAIIDELGCKDDLSKLDSFTYDELVAAGQRASRALSAAGERAAGFGPVVDGKFITQHPYDPVAPDVSRDVPMLIGTNFNEFTFDINLNISEQEVKDRLVQRMGTERAEAFIKEFKETYPNQPAEAMLYMDTSFRSGAIQQATVKYQKGGAPAYLFLFTWAPENNALGASHGMELPMMFNNVAVQREMTGASPSAYKMADVMSDYWISFIKTGNPNTKGLLEWEPFTEESGACMILDNNCELRYYHDKELLGI